jgi:HSP20 family protein
MPTVIRKTQETLMGGRRGILHAVSWQVKTSVWDPPTDVYESEETYEIRMEIAGMRDQDFDLTIQDGSLVISGFRPDSTPRRAYHQMEIRSGRFVNVIALPGPVDADRALAEYQDGFLVVSLPKDMKSQGDP